MKCEFCIRDAVLEPRGLDANTPGTHPSECGYRRQFLCLVHAMERRQVATNRLKPLMLKCPRCRAVGPWDFWGTNPRQGTLQCMTCASQGYDMLPEFVTETPAS